MQKKRHKKWILRGLKLRGLTCNQMNTPYFIYEIDQRKKLNTLDDFENQTPTHIDVTHAFSKSNSQGIDLKPLYLQNRHK